MRNETAGLHLHARTTCPGWLGEPLDVGWAIDVLHPRALQPMAIDEQAVDARAKIRGGTVGPDDDYRVELCRDPGS